MPHCMAPNCTNGWRKTKGTNVTYHRLPTDHMRSVWLQKIRRENPRDAKYSFVCSDHFTTYCFVVTLAQRLCGHTGNKSLETRNPTQFQQYLNIMNMYRRRLEQRATGDNEFAKDKRYVYLTTDCLSTFKMNSC